VCANANQPRITGLARLFRSAGSLDFYNCVTQLHRERTEQVAALYPVACLARLPKRRGGGANASRTDRLRSGVSGIKRR
jgi:hypothetical protein